MSFKQKQPKVFSNEEEAKKYLSEQYGNEFSREAFPFKKKENKAEK
ncbi:hypothetical protein [Oceanobacillus bengalensis]|nr:hypothetical protein [Oceanobacillus bengalensis]